MSGWPPLRGIRAAFVFLTRVPVGGFPYARADWVWSSAHFPLVGAVLGAVLGGAHRMLLPVGPLAAAMLVLGLSLLLTGAFHEDGIADTSDALGGAYDRDKVHEILKDSRVGTFGASALVISIAGRAALISRLGLDAAWAFPLIGCAARVGPIWQMVALPYATPPFVAKSRDIARAGLPQALAATAWFFLLATAMATAKLVSPARVVVLIAVLMVVTLVSGYRYARRLGGVTGDFLGATEQLCELAGFAVLAWGAA